MSDENEPQQFADAAAAAGSEATAAASDAAAAVTSDVPVVPTPPPAPTVPAASAPDAAVAPAVTADPSAPAQWPSAGYVAPPAAAGAYPPAYSAPGYGYAPQTPAAPTSSNAVIALILAVLSWAFCPIVAAIVALIFAHQASREIEASGGRVQGRGLVTASRWVAWINIGLFAAMILIGGFVLLLIAIAGGMSSN